MTGTDANPDEHDDEPDDGDASNPDTASAPDDDPPSKSLTDEQVRPTLSGSEADASMESNSDSAWPTVESSESSADESIGGESFSDESVDAESFPDESVDAESMSGPAAAETMDGQSLEEEPPGERSGPMADLADEVRQRRDRDEAGSEYFDEEDVSTVDPDVVWEQLESDDPIDDEAELSEEREEQVIDTGKFCERCEHFSAPPEVHCSHEGTEIVELVEVGTFRVLDCPKVKEEEQLEEL